MSSIVITKGEAVNLAIGVTNNDVPIEVNDGNWVISVELRWQTKYGSPPFPLIGTASGNNVLIALSDSQTNQLSHLGSGYVLAINVDKTDSSVSLVSYIQVDVLDGV